MKVYVQAKSKKELNERLASGAAIYGVNYSIFDDGGTYKLDAALQDGTVVALYEKKIQGTPVAKAWCTWKKGKVC